MTQRLLLASEVVAFTDAELDQYLEASRLPNGDRMVQVVDPDNLPDIFINRLRDRARPHSKPVDLNQVTARLLQPAPAPARRRSLSISSASTSCSTVDPEELFQGHLQQEKEAYHELARDGGRPFYPIELLPDLSRHPERHPEIVRFWSEPPTFFWRIFATQLLRWQLFRDYQKENRDPWKGKMTSYQEQSSSLLTRYSITLPPFQFQQDWTRQDKLTNWIEYACYATFVMRGMARWDPAEYKLRVAQLGWIADQIPLIQAEMEREVTAGNVGVKRSRTEDDGDGSGEPPAKKQRAHAGERERAAAGPQPSATLSGPQLPDAVLASNLQTISAAPKPKNGIPRPPAAAGGQGYTRPGPKTDQAHDKRSGGSATQASPAPQQEDSGAQHSQQSSVEGSRRQPRTSVAKRRTRKPAV